MEPIIVVLCLEQRGTSRILGRGGEGYYFTLTIIDLPRRPSLNSSLLPEMGVLTPCTDTWVQ